MTPPDIPVEEIVRRFDMQPHPEGGYYKETYRSGGTIPAESLPAEYNGTRCFGTAIYYLLPAGTRSRLHKLNSDEIMHFYLGDPMVLVQLLPGGQTEVVELGHDIAAGQRLQHVIPRGAWFGGYPKAGGRFSLIGCTVAPGFEFADLSFESRENLLRQFPDARPYIDRLAE